MALRAWHAPVPALQRIRCRSVLLQRESGGLPSVQIVAGGALPTIRPLSKLSVVRIGLVAIHAPGKGQWLFKIAVGVALRAVHADMFSGQRKFCFGVIKTLIHRAQRNFLPASGIVAGLALLLKTSAMRIPVAIGTLVEGKAGVSRSIIGARRMALGALHRGMQSGQRIARPGVIELAGADCIPVFEIVALLAG